MVWFGLVCSLSREQSLCPRIPAVLRNRVYTNLGRHHAQRGSGCSKQHFREQARSGLTPPQASAALWIRGLLSEYFIPGFQPTIETRPREDARGRGVVLWPGWLGDWVVGSHVSACRGELALPLYLPVSLRMEHSAHGNSHI